MKCDIYLRKSRKDVEQEKKGSAEDTLLKHRRQLLEFANKNNYDIQMIHEEIVSGESISERPKIKKLLERIENQSIDYVLVMDIDRLGRGDMFDQGLLDRVFRYSGVKLVTPSEVYDPNDESFELVFGIKSLVARQELKAITRRLQNGRVNSAKEGKSISKNPPFGFIRNSMLRLSPDPATSWIINLIFERVIEGKGRNLIAKELNSLNAPTPSGQGNWNPSSIPMILTNEAYIGHIVWGKIKYIKQNGKYKRIKVPKEEWEVAYNSHEPIVSEEVFYKANQIYKNRSNSSALLEKKLSNPIAGIVKCSVCNHRLVKGNKPNRPNDSLKCPNVSCARIQKSCSLQSVESRILSVLNEYIQSYKTTPKEEKSILSDLKTFKDALKTKESKMKELQNQRNNLYDLLEQKVYTIEIFKERSEKLMKNIDNLQSEIDSLIQSINREKEKEVNFKNTVPKIVSVLEEYKNTDNIEKKNSLLKSVIQEVKYTRTKDMNKKDEFILEISLKH